MSGRILVTGGAGFVGSALVRRLHAMGHEVRVLDDFSRGKHGRLPDVEIRHGDIRDPQWVAHAMADVDTVFHLAYVQGTQTFYEKPRKVTEVALKGMMNVLDAIDGKELFLVSSSEVYQDAPTPTAEDVPLSVPDVTNSRYSYGAGKIACEVAALAYSDVARRTVIVRPHNIYGPDMGEEHVIPQLARRILDLGSGDLHIQGTGRETRSFCYISDCVDQLVLLLEKGEDRNVYHLGNDAEITIGELALEMARAYKYTVRVRPSALPKGSPPRRRPDISKMRALGFEPKVPLSEGLKPTLSWYAAHPLVAT